MEIFVRLAITKYFKTGICASVYDSLDKMFSENVVPFCSKFDSHKFRKDHLWNEDCDLVFKRNLNAIKTLYNKYSGKYALPG